MIVFNGVDLTDTIPVKIEDIVVSPIQLNPVARQRAIKFGAEFVRMGGGERTVTISFALLEMNHSDREEAMSNLREWANIGKEYVLELPQFNDRHLECCVTQLPDYSYRKWWENKLQLVFTCYNNPYWTSNQQIDVPCGTLFSVGGNAQPLMQITRNGNSSLSNQTYSNGTESMKFTTIPSGNLTIDLNRQTAAIGSTSIMKYYSPTSKWLTPKIGANQKITGVGTVKYRERWV